MSIGQRLSRVVVVLALVGGAVVAPLVAAVGGSGAAPVQHVAGCPTCPRPPEQNI